MENQQCYTGQWVNWNNKWEQWDLVYRHRLFIVLASHSSLLSHSGSFYRTVCVTICREPVCYISFITLQLGCFNERSCEGCLLKEGSEAVNRRIYSTVVQKGVRVGAGK